MRFSKLQAMGNDFLVVDQNDLGANVDLGRLAVAVCDRHFGAGADGIVVISDVGGDVMDVRSRIFNADGSEAEVSGNGTRCVAAYLAMEGRWPQDRRDLRVGTMAGVKLLRLVDLRGVEASIEMDMGRPGFSSAGVPMALHPGLDVVVEYPIEIGGETWLVTATSMGNPHCTVFVDDLDAIDFRGVGAAIERHSLFPNRTNVEFVQPLSSDRIRALFWERGVGATLSSGTGSSAAAVASALNNKTTRRVHVETPAGTLVVDWRLTDDHVLLTGPAQIVYRGDWVQRG